MVKFSRRCCPRTYTSLFILGIAVVVVLHWALKGHHTHSVYDEDFIPPQIDFPRHAEFSKMVKEIASDDKVIIIALVDTGYVDLALNFYQSSIVKHGISNFIYIALDHITCQVMAKVNPSLKQRCFLFPDAETGNFTSFYPSKHFKDRIHLRRFFVLEALKIGHTTLITDLDMIYLENPLNHVKKSCGKCDMAAMWDDHLESYDAGFIYARATEKTKSFYNRLASYELSHGSGQLALNAAFKDSQKEKHMKVVKLNKKQYTGGMSFFPKNTCPEPKAYKGVYVVHNNYIREIPNKIFRLKECMLWDWNGFHNYFDDANRKFLTVETTGARGFPEHQTLLNAFSLAKLTHRTVILPRVECKRSSKCNLLTRIYDYTHLQFIKRFDIATRGNYRESTFLQNPRVPSNVKDSYSPIFHIVYGDEEKKVVSHGEPIKRMIPADTKEGPSLKEIKEWFFARPERVLRFNSLTGWFSNIKYIDLLGENLVKLIREL